MPHYKDGGPAYVGDVLKTVDGRIGTVVNIMPSCTACNAQVALMKVSTPETVYYQKPRIPVRRVLTRAEGIYGEEGVAGGRGANS